MSVCIALPFHNTEQLNRTEQMTERDPFDHPAVDRFRRRRLREMTPQQRQRMGERLIQDAMELLKSSPDGYEAFLRRNFRKRRDRMDMRR